MPAGFQVFGASGELVVNITDRITRVVAFLQVGPGTGSYTVTTSGTPFAAVLDEPQVWSDTVAPTFYYNGSVVSWSGGRGAAVTVMIGVY